MAGVRVIPGIEMSSRFRDEDVHVLGYGIDFASPALQRRLGEIQGQRRERVGRICEKLAELGVALAPEEVLREAGGKSVGRKHVARAMLKKGHVRSLDEAFRKFLGTGMAANVPANEMSPYDAATLIRAHGGLPVLAHPGFFDDPAFAGEILDHAPLAGIEVFHRYRSSTRHLAYLELARRRNLLVTGGSDFHGDDNAKNAALGAFTCPAEHWKDFEKRLGAP